MKTRFQLVLKLSILLPAILVLLSSSLPARALGPSSSNPMARREVAPPAGIDLDVTYISRSPLYKSYCVEYPWDVLNQPGIPRLCPGTENDRRWPEPGEIVTFTAHIVNKGTLASPAFGYAWQIDGETVAGGTLPSLAPAAEQTVAYQWTWGHTLSADGQRLLGEHTVGLLVDPAGLIPETFETNNSLIDPTNAMSFALFLPPEMYAAYNIPVDPQWPWSAEDWLQKQVAAMNWAFANSTYPVTPQGSALRVRVDSIQVSAADPVGDGAHDGMWFLRDDVRHPGWGYYDATTDIDWGLVHELSHQVSIIDMYALGVYASNVFVQQQDGTPFNVGFFWSNVGLMGGGDISPHTDPHLYESHSAAGASTYAGYRNGYYGSYMFDIPLNNDLRILDSQGHPAAGVQVSAYQRTGPWDWTGQMGVDNLPEFSGTTDAQGIFHLPNRSVHGGTITLNGHVLHDNPFGVVDIIGNQGLLLVRLSREGNEEVHWLDITEFNLAYWQGDTTQHTFEIASHLPPPGAPSAPQLSSARIEAGWAGLDWQPSLSPDVAGYRVYRAAAPQYEYLPASDLLTDTHFEEYVPPLGDGEHRLYAVTAVDNLGRESGFARPVYAPVLGEPQSIALAPDGSRTLLHTWSLYPLLTQQPDGLYTHRLVNVHYDLNNAHSLAYDPAGRLLVSGFGESPNGRYAMRFYDQHLEPLWAFGTEGDAPGGFNKPGGLAWWGQPLTIGGPYALDSGAGLLLHFEGTTTGAGGEAGMASGTSFEAGKHGQALLVDGDDSLSFPTAGNLNRLQGSLEFWVQPTWDGDDGQNHFFFETGQAWNNGMRFYKEGTGRLRFLLWDSSSEYGVDHMLDDWQAGEWHHLAVTWSASQIALYVDFQQVDADTRAGVMDVLPSQLTIGSSPYSTGQRADALIDELRISEVVRLGNSDSCGRILVVDSASQQVQAFDALGQFLDAFGTPGSGPGQFNHPQGLVVDPGGRVVIADQGNNRLAVLGFDGQAFNWLSSYKAGFNAPTGLAVDAFGYLAVADTGNNRIVILDPTGQFRAEFSAPDDGYAGPFNAPRAVAIEADGDLVVADSGNRRVVTVHRAVWRPDLFLPLVRR